MVKRREFLQISAFAASCLEAQGPSPIVSLDGRRKRLAAISSSYYLRSDADSVITRLLHGYRVNDHDYQPPCEVVSLYMDRLHPADIGHRLSAVYGFPVVASIPDALTLGTGKLAVDGIVMIAESSDGELSREGQWRDYRSEWFEQIFDVFRESHRAVPVFCENYLALDWNDAKHIYDRSREMGSLLMAGSWVPVTFRRPDLEYPLPSSFDDRVLGDRNPRPEAGDNPLGVQFEEALVISDGSEGNAAVFHALEVLESVVERRKGGETGLRAVQYLAGDAVWRAAAEGRWSKELMLAALERAERLGAGCPENVKQPRVCLLEYNDGMRAAILSLSGFVSEHLAAFRVKGRREIESTLCAKIRDNYDHFSMLVHGIVQMFVTGSCPYPVERNLLTGGATSFLLQSANQGYVRIETPMLGVTYMAPEHSFYAPGRGS